MVRLPRVDMPDFSSVDTIESFKNSVLEYIEPPQKPAPTEFELQELRCRARSLRENILQEFRTNGYGTFEEAAHWIAVGCRKKVREDFIQMTEKLNRISEIDDLIQEIEQWIMTHLSRH